MLFELISARYERRSLLITANQPFGDWNKVFPDETTAVAAAWGVTRWLWEAISALFDISPG